MTGGKSSIVEFRDVLRPHMGKLIPRVLRGCHDPNNQTKEQMLSLWHGLTGGGAEGRLAVSQHLIVTIDSLIKDCSSKLWRARVGAWYVYSQYKSHYLSLDCLNLTIKLLQWCFK